MCAIAFLVVTSLILRVAATCCSDSAVAALPVVLRSPADAKEAGNRRHGATDQVNL